MSEESRSPKELVLYLNGDFVPQEQASISVFDHAVLYGDGVYDTICAWNGYLFRLDEHIPQRMSEVGVLEEAVPKMAEAAVEIRRLLDNNPRAMILDDIIQTYHNLKEVINEQRGSLQSH